MPSKLTPVLFPLSIFLALEEQQQSEPKRNDVRFYSMAIAIPLAVVVVVFVVFGVNRVGGYSSLASAASFGDSFGYVNALFSGLAFAGVITAILIQARELRQAFEEQQDTREAHQAAAQLQQRSTIVDAIATLVTMEEELEYDGDKFDAYVRDVVRLGRVVSNYSKRLLLERIVETLPDYDPLIATKLPSIANPTTKDIERTRSLYLALAEADRGYQFQVEFGFLCSEDMGWQGYVEVLNKLRAAVESTASETPCPEIDRLITFLRGRCDVQYIDLLKDREKKRSAEPGAADVAVPPDLACDFVTVKKSAAYTILVRCGHVRLMGS